MMMMMMCLMCETVIDTEICVLLLTRFIYYSFIIIIVLHCTIDYNCLSDFYVKIVIKAKEFSKLKFYTCIIIIHFLLIF